MKVTAKKVILFVTTLTSVAMFSANTLADPMLSTGGYARQLQNMEMMKMIDADGNHMVTEAESDAYHNSVFDALNKDGDDSLEANEWAGPSKNSKLDLTTGGYSRELRSMKMMRLMDVDGDHKVTREEFLRYHRVIFASLDHSGDKEISATEWSMRGLLGK